MQWRTRAGDEVAARLGEPLTKDLDCPGAAHRAGPAAAPGSRRCWRPPTRRLDRGPPPRAGRGRTGDRHRPGLRACLRRPAQGDHRRAARSWCCRTRRRRRRRSRRSPRATTAGWSRSGWSPRASTCRAWRSASTPPRPRRPCSSPRRSAASCAPASGARPPRSSCPRAGHLLGLASEMEVRARPRPGPQGHRRGRPVRRRGRAARPAEQAAESASAEEQLLPFEALGSEAALRPGAVRRRRVRPRRARCTSGPRRRWTSSASPACSSPTRCATCYGTASPSGPAARVVPPATPEVRRRRPRRSTHEQLALLRRELNGLVAAWNHRTGQPHGVTHAALRKECGGPRPRSPPSTSSQARIDALRGWATRQR